MSKLQHLRRQLKPYLAGLVLGFTICLIPCACGDKGVEPIAVPRDNKIYFASLAPPNVLYTFHTSTQTLDSAQIPWKPDMVTVSADGRRLYLVVRTSVVVLDAATLAQITDLPYPGRATVAVSPDNRYVAITGNDITILRTSDYSTAFSDTDLSTNGWFSSDSRNFYCASFGTAATSAYKVSLEDSLHPVVRKSFADGAVSHVVPSIDQTKLYLYLVVATSLGVFEVYDVSADSVIFSQTLSPASGSILPTPDGQTIIYTNPGDNGSSLPPPPLNLTFFDIGRNAINHVYYDSALFKTGTYEAPPNVMTITPDGRWLAFMGGLLSAYVFFVCDMDSNKVVYYQDWGGHPIPLTTPSVQLQP